MEAMSGSLIIFEGGDGTGKSTQAARLAGRLRERGEDPLHLREPGSTALGERLRRILLAPPESGPAEMAPEAEVLLYMACRAQLFSESILPGLAAGRCVVLERSYFSTFAYQGRGLGLDGERILEMGAWATRCARPSRVILLDLDPELGLQRLGGRRDRVESRDPAYHRRVRAGFLELAARFADLFRVVDARGTEEEVQARVLEALNDAL